MIFYGKSTNIRLFVIVDSMIYGIWKKISMIGNPSSGIQILSGSRNLTQNWVIYRFKTDFLTLMTSVNFRK